MMVFGTMISIFHLGFTHNRSNEGVESVFEIFSDNSDAFARISMQAIFNLESTCLLKNKRFLGAIYLNGAKKSAAHISNLGSIFKTNIEIDKELCLTGKGFECMVDLVAVY